LVYEPVRFAVESRVYRIICQNVVVFLFSHPKRGDEQNQSAAIKNDEMGDGCAQQSMSFGKGKQNQALPHQTDKLHDNRDSQHKTIFSRIPQRNRIRHVPHQEQDASSAYGGHAGYTGQFEVVNVTFRPQDENQRGLQVPGCDAGDQSAGEPDPFIQDFLNRLNLDGVLWLFYSSLDFQDL